MSDELREKMRAIVNRWPHTAPTSIADAAIALARDATLEEAAKAVREVLEEHGDILAKDAALRAIDALKGKPWNCPIKHPGCTSNCGSYGCGN